MPENTKSPVSVYPRTCTRCHGKGYHEERLQASKSTPYRFARNESTVVHIVDCHMCTGGQVTEADYGRYLRSIGGPAYDNWEARQVLIGALPNN
jgi:hypothetical protein